MSMSCTGIDEFTLPDGSAVKVAVLSLHFRTFSLPFLLFLLFWRTSTWLLSLYSQWLHPGPSFLLLRLFSSAGQRKWPPAAALPPDHFLFYCKPMKTRLSSQFHQRLAPNFHTFALQRLVFSLQMQISLEDSPLCQIWNAALKLYSSSVGSFFVLWTLFWRNPLFMDLDGLVTRC